MNDMGSLPVTRAYAVTSELRSLLALPADDDGVEEELADAAAAAAADAALRLLARQPAAPRRRVVVAADVAPGAGRATAARGADQDGRGDGGGEDVDHRDADHGDAVDHGDADDHPAAVGCPGGVPLSSVASILLDDDAAVPAVDAAVRAQASSDSSLLDAALDVLDDHVLSWYDVSELSTLVGSLPATGGAATSQDGTVPR